MKRENQTLDRTAAVILAPVLALLAAFLLAMTTLVASPDEAQAASSSETQTMYRLYNPNSGEHFYTASAGERDSVQASGWNYEGVAWTAPVSSSTPVYRLYSGTDHHYTTSVAERDNLMNAGWKYENIGWYSDDAQGVPLYRQFNPNVDPSASFNNSGSHNYTTSKGENDHLVSIGWIAEDIGWYGVDTSKTDLSEVVYQDEVIEVSATDWSTSNGKVSVSGSLASEIEKGSIVLLAPTDKNPSGSSMKVETIEEKDGTKTISGSQPELSEVVETLKVSGTTETVTSLTPAVEVVDGATSYTATSSEFDTLGKSISLGSTTYKPMDDMKVTISPSVDYDIDYSWGKLNNCSLTANVDADFTYEWSQSIEKKVKLFSSTFSTPVAGLCIDADFYLVLHASGEVKIEAEFNTYAGFTYDGKKINPVSGSDFHYTAFFDAQLGAGFSPELCLNYFGIGLVDVAPEAGVTVEGSITQHDTLVCDELAAWAYVDIDVGKKDTVLGFAMDLLNIKKEYHPLSKSNSKVWSIHVENGKVVPECTWGKDQSEDDPSSGNESKDTTPASDFEYAIGDFIADGTVYNGSPEDYFYDVRYSYGGGFEALIPHINQSFTALEGITGSASDFQVDNGRICGHGVYIKGYKGKSKSVVVPRQIDGLDVVYAGLGRSVSNELIAFDMSNCVSLKAFDCTEPASVDFGDINELRYFSMLNSYDDPLESLDMGKLNNLQYFCIIEGYVPKSLSLNTENLEYFVTWGGFTRLNLSGSSKLKVLHPGDSGYLTNETLNLDGCTALESIELYDNELTSFDVTQFPNLTWLGLSGNPLTSADVIGFDEWIAKSGTEALIGDEEFND